MEHLISLILFVLLIGPSHAIPFFLPRVSMEGPVVAVNRSRSATYRAGQTDRYLPFNDTPGGVPALGTKDPEDDTSYCPPTCQCNETASLLTVAGCKTDPANQLDLLLQRNLNVTTLNIQNSMLSRLSILLCNMTRLTVLDLTNNTLRDLPWECIESLRNLNTLNVPFNHIERLVNSSFNLPKLRYLGLQHNKISEIDPYVFAQTDRMPSIIGIDLSNNLLKTIDSWPLMFSMEKENTPEVLLRHNQISTFTNHAKWKLDCMNKKPTVSLDLQNNNITHIMYMMDALELKTDLESLCAIEKSEIDIRQNPFICDCIDYGIYRFLKLVHKSKYVNELFCAQPENLYAQAIMRVPLDKFICHVKEDCPDHCKCIDTPDQMNMSVICSDSGEQLPDKLPRLPKHHYTYHLNFMDSNLTNFEYRPYLPRVKQAFFSGNRMKNISALALFSLVQAEVIYFDHNQLKYLPANISMVNLTSSVRDLRLAENEWVCDCHTFETRAWMIREKERISDKSGILCAAPKRLVGFNLLKLSEKDLICGDPPNKVLVSTLITIGATLGISFLLFVLPFLIISIKKVWFYKTFKWHPFDKDECEGENKEFDVFVSYANENEVYVEEILIPGLESRGYKVAFHRVHFLAGKPIHVSIEECIMKSKRTLVVFSKDFRQSVWSMWEFTVALELDGNQGTHRLMAIKYEDINVKSLELTLQAYFNRYSYVERDSPRFWDNLQYTLPVNKLGTIGEKSYDVQRQSGENIAAEDPQYDEEAARPNADTDHLLS